MTFANGDIGSWADFDDHDFVAVGAVMMYLAETEAHELVTRCAAAQKADYWLYVRVTVVNPGRAPHETGGGYYRRKSF